jgi:hypothetical protein
MNTLVQLRQLAYSVLYMLVLIPYIYVLLVVWHFVSPTNTD